MSMRQMIKQHRISNGNRTVGKLAASQFRGSASNYCGCNATPNLGLENSPSGGLHTAASHRSKRPCKKTVLKLSALGHACKPSNTSMRQAACQLFLEIEISHINKRTYFICRPCRYAANHTSNHTRFYCIANITSIKQRTCKTACKSPRGAA